MLCYMTNGVGNLSDLEFDLSGSLNIKYDHVIGLSIYAFH